MRKVPFVEGEYYHIYNRGVDKRSIFQDHEDLERFFQSIKEFNSVEPIGSIFENSFDKTKNKRDKLVEIICYCINPNHFHFILRQLTENGISEFMKRLGGYTWYFNNKHRRSGALFQGVFKSKHIDNDSYLRHVSAYVNLNNRFKGEPYKLSKSSWEEYIGDENDCICSPEIVLGQFRNPKEYQSFARASLKDILKRKELEKELES
ncbi:MAG: transposase [Candidatus Zambryskibacteria bacterium]|nr:transposase [Candidatus Zambryskibacteria bacterium]